MSDLHVNWEDYYRTTEELAMLIRDSDWQFNQVVCIARGGLRVGDALSRIFNVPLAIMFTSSYREEGGKKQNQLVISQHLTMATETLGDRVLLVDDLVDSGVTLRRVIEDLKQRYPHVQDVRTAVLWQKACSVFTPDYTAKFLADNPWIHQPMEVYDDLDPSDLK